MATSKTTTSHTSHTEYGPRLTEFHTKHASQPYVVSGMDYETDYVPAYTYALQVADEHKAKSYTDVATTVKSGWDKVKGKSRLSFEQAEPAIRAAFDRTIQLREEQLKVHKTESETGSVQLKKEVHTEHKSVTVPVTHEEIVIERHAVNKPATGTISAHGEEVRVAVTGEKVHVSKEAVVTEEVSVGKRKVQGQETVGADLKREELVVDKTGEAKVTHTDSTKKKS